MKVDPQRRRCLSRRTFVAALAAFGACARPALSQTHSPPRILLRSSWQTVNIGDIAHTPGMLALLEKHRPDAQITLWPNKLSQEVEQLLVQRFPKLKIAATADQQAGALAACDFFLHGSGPGLVGREAARRAMQASKPYGFAGITLSDDEIKTERALLAGAKFVFCRDTDSLKALKASGISGPQLEFGPDATFALDLRDEAAADKVLAEHKLSPGKFLCAVPRLRYTPYWEIHPERKFDAAKDAVNQKFTETDHAKLREAITAWVRQIKQPVLLCPEMTYEVSRLRPLLFDKLPSDVKPHVRSLDRYWLTAEAASVYARAAAVVSMEQHSPIMAIAAGTPAILVRQPTDTRKGQMWRDIGLDSWIFEIDDSTGEAIGARVVEVGRDALSARKLADKARMFASARMGDMIKAIPN
jgi:polysaccharide pyruvyl transferase WcaK-like protein